MPIYIIVIVNLIEEYVHEHNSFCCSKLSNFICIDYIFTYYENPILTDLLLKHQCEI